MSLSEKVQQINREISATVERAVADLRQEVSQQLRAGHDEILRRLGEITPELPRSFIPEDLVTTAEQMAEERAAARAEESARAALLSSRQSAEAAEQSATQRIHGARNAALADVREALANIDRARSQAEILAALLRETGRFSSRAAVLLLRGNELRGWGGQGFGEAEPGIRDLAFPAADGNSWSRLSQGQAAVHLSAAECAELCSRIDAPLPREGVLIPLVLRDRVAAGLYADRLRGGLDAAALQILCYTAAMAIELLPFRERPFTPTLAIEGEPSGEDAPAEEPVPDSPLAAIAAAPEPDQIEPAYQEEAVPQEGSRDLSDTMAGTEPAYAAEPDAGIETGIETGIEPEPEPLVDMEAAEIEATPEPEPQAWATPEPEPPVPAFEEPEPAPEMTPEPSPAATVYQPIPVEAFQAAAEPPTPTQPMSIYSPASSADQTVLMQRSPLREVPAPAATPPPIPQQATREV
ncbi:MAG TPA: hypothetical protein VJ885_11215, partial [Thermoanaerobaculia bacterium]|nr:hypothetical protein [Thermoanaerobaculia bacterium]